ncbi:MAG: protein kinase domain-containing protein, partial [Terriglobia bacterium]
MKPERWREIERLYQAALERAASGREAFLREACGADDDLRREVESLLESNDEAGSFIERPAIEVAAGSVAEEVDRRVRGDGLRSPDHPQSPGHSRESVNPALQPGAAVSHYRIVERIGAGGMGVVYRAEDTTLKRQVALKFLPEAFAQDADRLSRFKREAQVLASLNHPNIASIYGLEEAGGVLALVMELVEGKTLAGRIQSGAIPLEEALPLAKQIAEALEAAHDKGIIHRDLKPANIKITPERAAKVLDFGLAKVLDVGAGLAPPDRAQQALPLQNAPTLSTAATETGMILGTAGYMSPEQAKGQRVDRRADIWAFGCVLFEMISGRKAFEGETMPETLAAVLKSEPDWSALGSDTPPPVQALIRRCLVKDPKQRLQAIGDARITIEETISGVFSADSVAASLPPTDAQTTPLHSWRRALPWARVPLAKRHEWVIAGVVVAVAILAAVAWGLYSHFAQQVSVPFQNFTITQITDSGDEKAAAISPDGKYILSVRGKGGLESLWLRNVPTGSDTQIIAPAAAAYSALTFSPDGNYVYYRKAAGPGEFNLFRAPVLGGTPRLIVIDIDTSITFSPDGQHIAYWRFNDPVVGQARLLSASLDGSGERTLLVKPVNALYYSIAWSP